MKQFSLEEYLKNPDRKVVTRDGRNARIICTDRKSNLSLDGPIIALIDDIEEGREYCFTYFPDGTAYENVKSKIDLFFAPTKHEGWINLYVKGINLIKGGIVYKTKEEAEKMSAGDEDYVTTVKVKWEDYLI